MQRQYVLSQSLAYLVTGITMVTSGQVIQKSGICCIGDIFIIIGIILGISNINDRYISKIIEIDRTFENLLFQCSMLFCVSGLILLLNNNAISPSLVTILSWIVGIYAILIVCTTCVSLKTKISHEPRFWCRLLSDLMSIRKKQLEQYAIMLFIICSLAAILSSILQDGALLYLVIVDYVSIITILVVTD
jgi:hypothetical protein